VDDFYWKVERKEIVKIGKAIEEYDDVGFLV
jgi:choline kinase